MVLSLALLWPARTASQRPSTEELLDRATRYVAEFVNRFSNVVAEERYIQEVRSPRRQRVLKSDFLLVKPPGATEWYQFRDVLEVDGKPILNREVRLTQLFTQPSKNVLTRAAEVSSEGARYNLQDIGTMNKPLTAISFLQSTYRGRFRFTLGGIDKPAGPDARIVQFQEYVTPTIVRSARSNGEVFMRGLVWIEETTGRVLKTELRLGPGTFASRIVTTFRFDDDLQINVPVEMRESYYWGRDEMTTTATYGRFRRFEVRTDETFR